jgi:hypothetical protein
MPCTKLRRKESGVVAKALPEVVKAPTAGKVAPSNVDVLPRHTQFFCQAAPQIRVWLQFLPPCPCERSRFFKGPLRRSCPLMNSFRRRRRSGGALHSRPMMVPLMVL